MSMAGYWGLSLHAEGRCHPQKVSGFTSPMKLGAFKEGAQEGSRALSQADLPGIFVKPSLNIGLLPSRIHETFEMMRRKLSWRALKMC